jgi:hypothetical protein
MKLAAFLIGRRPMHPEHAEHYAGTKTVRIGVEMMKQVVIVVHVSKIAKWRIRAAFWLMKIAGRLGGFKAVRLEREK